MSKPYMCGDEVAVYVPEGGCDCNYTLQRVDDPNYNGTYKLMLNGSQVGDLVTVPQDRYVNAASIKTVEVAEVPYAGAKVGDAYLDITFANYSEHIYVSLASIMGGGYLIVDELPETGDSRYIYLVDDGQGNYDRYVWTAEEEGWVNIGGTAIDLSNYYTKTEVDGMINNIMLRIYPIGSIYTSIDDTDPGTLFGGAWTRLTDTFLYAVPSGQSDQSATTKTAGSANATLISHTHTTPAQTITASHYHHAGGSANDKAFVTMNGTTDGLGRRRVSSNSSGSGNAAVPGQAWNTSVNFNRNTTTESTSQTFTVTAKTTNSMSPSGGSATNANMPPYMKVYMWKRIA